MSLCADSDARCETKPRARRRCRTVATGSAPPSTPKMQDGGGRGRVQREGQGLRAGRPAEEHAWRRWSRSTRRTAGCSPTTAVTTAPASTTPARTSTGNGATHRRAPARLVVQDLHPGGGAQGRQLARLALGRARAYKPGGHRRSRSATPADDNPSCGKNCTLASRRSQSLQRAVLPGHREDRRRQGRRHGRATPASPPCGDRTNPAKAYDLTKTTRRSARRTRSTTWSAIGQYPITVLDHANGMATSPTAASTTRRTSSSRSRSRTRTPASGTRSCSEQFKPKQRDPTKSVADEVNDVLKQIYPARNHASRRPPGGRQDRHLGAQRRQSSTTRTPGCRLHPAVRHRGLGRQRAGTEKPLIAQGRRQDHRRFDLPGRRSGSGS